MVNELSFHNKTTDDTHGNAFKEEAYNTYLMKNYEKIILGNNLNQYNIIDIIDILDKDILIEERSTNYSTYGKPSLWKDFSFFCKTMGLNVGDVHDKLLIYAIMKIPNRTILLDINMKMGEKNDVQHNVEDVVLRRKLKSAIDRMLDLTQKDTLNRSPMVYKNFMELMLEGARFKNPSKELTELLEQGQILL